MNAVDPEDIDPKDIDPVAADPNGIGRTEKPLHAQHRGPQEKGEFDHRPTESSVLLTGDDFQRIGLAPRETRLPVIRAAAMRIAKSLADRQMAAPSDSTQQQLFRVALSTYRLLDPRQRTDRHARAHVGRIRPGELFHAGQTAFADDGVGLSDDGDFEESAEPNAAKTNPLVDLQLPQIEARLVRGIRRRATEPLGLVLLIVLLLMVAAGLFWWGFSHKPRGFRSGLAPANHAAVDRMDRS
ncbi:MAG: hypothetical protein AAF802_22490 [Planctomycetota bacterium]